MKKKIIIILSGLMVSVLFQGCSKFVEEENVRSPVADTYYKTATGFKDLINSCYTNTRSLVSDGDVIAAYIFGTDLWTSASDKGVNEFNTYSAQLTPSSSVLYSIWSGCYKGINACNTAISRSKNVSGMSQDELNSRTGEAYFLRAWFYSNLVMQFGAIPLITEEVTQVVTTATRTPEDSVYNQIIDDLKKAEQFLPASQSDFGRATKPAAEAMLARIYITLNQNEEAATYAKKVISDYNFKLLPDYAQLWNPDNDINSEVIFSINFSRDLRLNAPGTGSSVHLFFTPRYDLHPGMTRALNYDRPYPRYMATRFYLDLMQSNRWKDSRYDKSWREVYLANYAATLPPGMKIGDTAYIVVPYAVPQSVKDSKPYQIFDINFYYHGEMPYGALEIYPKLTKYDDPNRASVNQSGGTRSFIEIRLAEMYFIAAEALMKQGKSAEGVEYMNTVLRRAAWPGHEADMEITADKLTLDFILNQRALEFGGERLRWTTLKRTDKLIDRVKLYNPAGRDNIEKRFLLRPIPSKEIDRLTNKAGFPQNPGY